MKGRTTRCASARCRSSCRTRPHDRDAERDESTGRATEEAEATVVLGALALVDDGLFVAIEGAAVVPCGAGGVVHEGDRVEVRTRYCDPADLAGPLERALPAGTMVELELSHDPLLADGGAVHLALVVGDEVVWDLERSLPTAAAFFHERLPLAFDHSAGERVIVHIHNHGANSYAIHGVRFGPP